MRDRVEKTLEPSYQKSQLAQQERLHVLEMLVGYEKLALQAEIENLRRSLTDRTT